MPDYNNQGRYKYRDYTFGEGKERHRSFKTAPDLSISLNYMMFVSIEQTLIRYEAPRKSLALLNNATFGF